MSLLNYYGKNKQRVVIVHDGREVIVQVAARGELLTISIPSAIFFEKIQIRTDDGD